MHNEAADRMPFGRFYSRAVATREVQGFTLACHVPYLRKRDVREHVHEGAHFVFVLRGNYESNARPVELAGEEGVAVAIYSPPGTAHRDGFTDPSGAAFATLSVAPSALDEVAELTRLPTEEIRLPRSSMALVRRLLVEASAARHSLRDDLSDGIAEALCLELLARMGVECDSVPQSAPRWLARARDLLRDSCFAVAPRSVGEIARQLDLHPVYFARRFRRHFGVTPGEYLRHCRLENARRLVRRSTAALAEIATVSGFSDQSHFTNAFRARFGVSPGEFRRRSG